MANLLELFSEPIVEEYTNCVAWAMADPFACLFRRALSCQHVVPCIKKARAVKKIKNRDIAVWWDDLTMPDGSYHFALIQDDSYLMKIGRGVPVEKHEIVKCHDKICSQFEHHKVVRNFKMPLVNIEQSQADMFYKLWEQGEWGPIIKLFQDFDQLYKEGHVKEKERNHF